MKKTKRTALFEKKEVDFINVGIEEIMFTNLWSMLFLLHFVYKDLDLGEERKSKNLIDQLILGCYETYRPCLAEGTFCSDKASVKIGASNLVLPFPSRSRHGPARQEEDLIHGQRSERKTERVE